MRFRQTGKEKTKQEAPQKISPESKNLTQMVFDHLVEVGHLPNLLRFGKIIAEAKAVHHLKNGRHGDGELGRQRPVGSFSQGKQGVFLMNPQAKEG